MIYAIVGPTGVGKTKLSIMLAKYLDAEIINCDSMQIYKELNIGTAKVTEKEMSGIRHHLLNIKSITEDYSVFDYQQDGRKIIADLQRQNKNIIIVGGTGLYLKALLYNYEFNKENKSNRKLYDAKIVGLTRDRNVLYENINLRVDKMITDGLIEEVKQLYDKNLNTRAINTAIGYKELYRYFAGQISFEESIDKIKQASRNYAKRQYTFFNNQFKDDITWYNIDEISFEKILKDIIKNS